MLEGSGLPSETAGGYPAEWIETVTLQDGTCVTIRPIRPDDAPRLQKAFKQLSQQTIYLRFLETFKELSDKQAQQFAAVDYQQRMALVGCIPDCSGDDCLIGVARYAMLGPDKPGVAETAITVTDEYQGRGLGLLLLNRLVRYARRHGVCAFLATVHHSNSLVMRFIKKSELPWEKKIIEPGVWSILVHLDQDLEVKGK